MTAPASAEFAETTPGVAFVRGGAASIVPVTGGEPLRITASGTIAYALAVPACAGVGPGGCLAGDATRARPVVDAPPAALIATFRDEHGDAVAQSFAPGEAALVRVPAGARDLALSVNLADGDASHGEFMVAALPVALHPVRRAAGPTVLTERMKAQHLLRRFGFSTNPAEISRIAAMGVDTWFTQQLQPANISDALAIAKMEPLPTTTNSTGGYLDWNVWERRLIEREFYTQRQVQEKMVLHWLDHFSVGNGKVGDPPLMSAYETVLRTNALGNFTTMATAVSRTAAMLIWLDNNWNDGSNPAVNPPNENFARELMQLYTIGPYQLNIDGSVVTNAQGVPVPSFGEADVKAVAQGLTGFYVDYDYKPYTNPETRFRTMFTTYLHTPGSKTILGNVVNVPDASSCADYVINSLTTYPSSAPFLVKELLQRLAIENPSPRYIAEVAKVWQQNVHAPNQIALVLQTIERDPEFYSTDYHSMNKEPVELFVQMTRDMPFVLRKASYGGGNYAPPASALQWYLKEALQEPYYPPSVFSFYYPGNKDQLISQASLLTRFDELGSLATDLSTYSWADTALDIPELRARIGSTQPAAVEAYLLDAFVDSNSPTLATSLKAYLGTSAVDDQHLQGAIWIITTSPEFEVN